MSKTKLQPIVQPGTTCWRTARAGHAAVLVDAANYLPAMASAMRGARRSILLLGWDFDPRVPLAPETGGGTKPQRFCDLLETIVSGNPEIRVHILIWDMTWFYAVQRRDRPQHAGQWLPKERVSYRLDGDHPLGASHHQKVLVVDDSIAFCGGADFTRNRWDTTDHLPADGRRLTIDGSPYGPRHEVMMAVDGDAAVALGDVVRERWLRATGERLEPPARRRKAWPDGVKPDFAGVDVAIARTEPAWKGREAVREAEALYLSAIAAAKRWIYFENQYVTSPVIAQALERRLREADGPEIIIVCPAHSGGRFDRLVMDHARNEFVCRLASADRYGRFRAFAAMADGATPISVHSKVMFVDDRLAHVGSANLNNRSFGFDTECDVSIEAKSPNQYSAIRRLVLWLLAEHAGCSADRFEAEVAATGSLLAAIDAVGDPARRHLRAFDVRRPGALDRIMGTLHFLDPFGVEDNWRPWRRLRRG